MIFIFIFLLILILILVLVLVVFMNLTTEFRNIEDKKNPTVQIQ